MFFIVGEPLPLERRHHVLVKPERRIPDDHVGYRLGPIWRSLGSRKVETAFPHPLPKLRPGEQAPVTAASAPTHIHIAEFVAGIAHCQQNQAE